MKHIRMFRAALVTLAAVFAGGYVFAEETQVEDTPEVEEVPKVTKVTSLKPKYTSTMTVEGYSGETELENFPVAVRISPDTISGFKYADCTGQDDITFTDANGNILPHEVEVWNIEGESVAWVSIPKLATVVAEDKTTYTTFKMNWGHEMKLADTKATEVWTGANYLGVFHMNTPIDTTAATSYQKNSSVGPDLTMIGASPSLVSTTVIAGKVLKNVYAKTSTGDILKFPTMIKSGVNASGFMLSGWAYWSGYKRDGAAYVMEVRNPTSSTYPWELTVRYNNPGMKFGTSSPIRDTGTVVYSGWFHWAIVVSGKRTFKCYINGVHKSSKTVDNDKFVDNATDIYYQTGGTSGYTDEIRIHNVAASADWIKAEYDSINNKQFVVASEAVKNGYGLKIIVR